MGRIERTNVRVGGSGRNRVSLSISKTDKGMDRLRREMTKLAKKPYTKVGIQANAGEHKGGELLVLIATVHEFGSAKAHIPERMPIRLTMRKHKEELEAYARGLFLRIMNDADFTTETAVRLLGERIQGLIQKEIQGNLPPPLKLATIIRKNQRFVTKARKKLDRALKGRNVHGLADAVKTVETGGSSTALIDTGQLVRAYRHKAVMNGKD